jgi:hypothetical protein
LAVLVALAASLVMSAASCGEEQEDEELSRRDLLLLTVESWRQHVASANQTRSRGLMLDGFLHGGRGLSDFQRWMDDLSTRAPLQVGLSRLAVQTAGDEASVDYVLSVRGCGGDAAGSNGAGAGASPSDEYVVTPFESEGSSAACPLIQQCRASASAECGWIARWQWSEEAWRTAGDRAAWGAELRLRSTADGVSLMGGVVDPGHVVSAARIRWRGHEEAVELATSASSIWSMPANATLPEELSNDAPLPWFLDLEVEHEGGKTTKEIRFDSVMGSFASAVSPSGEAKQPITFKWQRPNEAEGGVSLEVWEGSALKWRSPRVFTESLPYQGPELSPEKEYTVKVTTYDLHWNEAVISSPLEVLPAEGVTPDPRSIDPVAGPAAGGTELSIHGEHFLSGARVEIGPAECGSTRVVSDREISCVTPPLEKGSHHVLVINPGSEVGLLESAFTAL